MARLNLFLLSALFLLLGLLPTIYAGTVTLTVDFYLPADSPTITHETLNCNIDVDGNLAIVDSDARLAKALQIGLVPTTIYVPTVKETASNGDITLKGAYTSPGTHRSRLGKRQPPTNNVNFFLSESFSVTLVSGLEKSFNINLSPFHGSTVTATIGPAEPGKAKRADSGYIGVMVTLILEVDLAVIY